MSGKNYYEKLYYHKSSSCGRYDRLAIPYSYTSKQSVIYFFRWLKQQKYVYKKYVSKILKTYEYNKIN